MRISVTDVDIRNGQRQYCQACPVARAINRATGKASHVEKSVVVLVVLGIWDAVTIDLPDVVEDWIERFDQGFPVEAFEFDLEIPGEAVTT